jgi:hypothetical protein
LNRAAALIASAAAIGAAVWMHSCRRDDPAPPLGDRGSAPVERGTTPRPRGPDEVSASSNDGDAAAELPGSPAPTPLDALKAALAAGGTEDAPRLAAALRRAMRADPESRSEAERLLVAAETSSALRQALALVIGTIAQPDPDALLLDAMKRFEGDAEFARACLLALGATREPEDDDDVFDLGDRPWGAQGPAGIGITVKREIADERTRARVVECLVRPDARVRAAATVALRHTTSAGDVRAAFRSALQGERDDVVAQELGEALTQAMRASQDAAERGEVLSLVLERAGDAPLDGMRFRVEDDLSLAHLDAPHVEQLRRLAQTPTPLAQRTFALTVLANAAKRGSSVSAETVRPLLVAGLGDTDAALRDLAARLLGALPLDAQASAALAKTAKDDAAWNVRWTALGSLAAKADPAVARAALETARGDADPRVASRAVELLAGLPGR